MMWKSIVYKEWLKIRWFLIGYTLLGILGIGYLFLTVKHGFAFSGGKNIWNSILFMGHQFFSPLKYVPLLGGLTIAIAQYFPETVNKRIKLTFHLPLRENKALLMMHAFGAVSLLLSFLVFFGMFTGFSLLYFPVQMVTDSIISIFPWFLAGFSAYFLVALIVLEPAWKFRLFYSLVGGFFLTIYLNSPVTGAYDPANSGLFVLTAFLSIALLFSAYRFRKGEM
ncbi:MAG: hypothetical protein Q8P34_05800 [Bacteroidota bacterium]|nr:hypothetical protein [Bacteroidota bacterium]